MKKQNLTEQHPEGCTCEQCTAIGNSENSNAVEALEYSLTDLVDFGAYLLSDERRKMCFTAGSIERVSDADLANWHEKKEIAYTN